MSPVFKYLLIGLALCLPPTVAAKTAVVTFTGPGGEPPRALRASCTHVMQTVPAGMVNDSLRSLLASAGYYDSRVNCTADTCRIDTGPLFELGAFIISIIDVTGVVAVDTSQVYRGLPAARATIEWVKDDILAAYQAAGYYFSSLNVDAVERDENALTLRVKIITGPPVVLERIRFRGLKKTRPEYAARLGGLRPGILLLRQDVEAAGRRLEAAGFLVVDSTPHIFPNQTYDAVEVLFFLTELKSNQLELTGGYLPRQGDSDGEFIGRVHFSSRNLFGRGRRLMFLYEKKDRGTTALEFGFTQPLFIPDRLEVTGHFRQVDRDSSYYAFTADGQVTLVTGAGDRLTGGLSWTKTEPQNRSQPPSRTLAGRFAYDRPRLEAPDNPAGGYRLQAAVSYLRRISWPDTVAAAVVNNESLFEADADAYLPLSRRWIIRLHGRATVFATARDLLDYSEQIRLGGFGSLRGYRQEEFAGRRIALGQAELRLRTSRSLAAYIFADVGYVYSRKERLPGFVVSEEITRLGSGAGLFVGTAAARMTLEMAWGRGDSFGDAKIHLGLMTAF